MNDDAVKLAREALEQSDKAVPAPWTVDAEADDGYTAGHRVDGITDGHGCDVVVADSGVYPPDYDTACWIAAARTREPLLAQAVIDLSNELEMRQHEDERPVRTENRLLRAALLAACDMGQLRFDDECPCERCKLIATWRQLAGGEK